jgi:urease accessory protein
LSEAAGLSGHLKLRCAARADGTSFVAKQSFAAPFHLSKTYWDGHSLLVHVVNPTAGLFGGDRLTTHVAIEPGARVVLSSPSAARFHPSREREVELHQRFEVRSGASLDIYPEISIPQRNSRARQRTSIDIERGGELLYLETLAPGRVASGEVFAFTRYAWQTDVRLAGRLIHRERAGLMQDETRLAGLRTFSPAGYYAGLLIVSPASEGWGEGFTRHATEIGGDGIVTGATSLTEGGWSVRILAADALGLRRAIGTWRDFIYQRMNRPRPDLRKY